MPLPPEGGQPKGDHVPGAWGTPSSTATPSPTTPPSPLLVGEYSGLDFDAIEAIAKYTESTWAADPPSPVLPPCTPVLVPPPTPRLRAWDLDHKVHPLWPMVTSRNLTPAPTPQLRAQDRVDAKYGS